MKLTRKHIQTLALLSSIRWYNILLIALAQYLTAFFVYNSYPYNALVFFDLKLHLLVLCTLLIVAAGFLVNDFYDFNRDMITRPKITLFQQYISKDLRIRLYFLLNTLGLIFAFIGSFQIFLFFATLSFLLWFYPHKLKKFPVLKEFTATLLSISCFFSISFHYGYIPTEIIYYGFYFFILLFTRQIIKGREEIKGELILNSLSLSGLLGDKNSRLFIRVSIIFQVVFSIFITQQFYPANWLYFIFFSNLILIGVFFWLSKLRPAEFYILHFVYKMLIGLGIFNLIFFSF